MEFGMRFVGQTEIAGFLAHSPAYGDTLRAWVAEMRHGRWASVGALAADFHDVDASALPTVNFYPPSSKLRIETIIDFRLGIVLLVTIDPRGSLRGNSQTWKARRDH